MKKILLLFLLCTPWARAHDHIEVGEDPSDSARLGLDGPGYQLALYVPPGEPFSGYLPNFPGDSHASELTFTTDVNAMNPAEGANPRIELVSVQGPVGGMFSFWEVGATAPTWSRPAGWTNSPGDIPSIIVILNGDNHAHGRAFTMDTPGEYTVVLRAVDAAGVFTTSVEKTITFAAQLPPRLSMRIENAGVTLSFTSRLNLDYDLQSCTNLSGGGWFSQATFSGDGMEKSHASSISGTPCVLYRLIEY